MYKDFSIDEKIVMIALGVFACAYALLRDAGVRLIPAEAALIIFALCAGYLCFNRVVKYLWMLKGSSGFFETECIIRDKMYRQMGRGRYPVLIAEYTDPDGVSHIKKIHSSFSIKKWEVGDRIGIRLDPDDPEKIMIPSSDNVLAVIMTVMGLIFETILAAIFIMHMKNS